MLRAVAALADICNISGSPAEYQRRLDVLRNYCLELGRDFGKIEKSWTGDVLIVNEEEKDKLEKLKLQRFTTEQYLDKHIVGTPEECISKIQAYIELGVTYFTVSVRTLEEDLELFADDVIKRVT